MRVNLQRFKKARDSPAFRGSGRRCDLEPVLSGRNDRKSLVGSV